MDEPGGDQPAGVPARGPLTRLKAQFRERPVIAWGGTAVLAGVVAAVVIVVLVGASEPRNVPISCTVYENSSTLRLTLHAKVTRKEANEGCGDVATRFSSAAHYWVTGIPPLPDEEPQEICALTSPEVPTTILVEEVPGSILGRGEEICGALSGAGWTQASVSEIGPGQREYQRVLAAEERRQEALEAREQEFREEEEAEEQEREDIITECDEAAEATEAEELKRVERETKERVAGAQSEDEGYEIEDEGFDEENEVFDRALEAEEACEAEVETETGETEYR